VSAQSSVLVYVGRQLLIVAFKGQPKGASPNQYRER